MQETITVELVEVAPFKALAVRTGMSPDHSGTRIAWSKLIEQVPLDDARLTPTTSAYVFIPQEQWGKEVDTLWVGLAVSEFGEVPDGIETLEVCGGLCACAHVHGDEAQMWRVYESLFAWLEESPDYKLDKREGILGMETVPLEPLNSLTIPYATVETFDFKMLYPVIKKSSL
ncbi:GyrI-like small molecule binding domain-containing protein [Paenibacillus sp. 1_12]|uniref:GyrI-like domain-containing protein n=1 Tax=Paenibacillus sp. 1_12 TaxID=1566278 RepID=UPI0008DFA231|nr:GyrI-like domain-containing protein [Paenibacillus sp. 1_12]SFK97732.1 GyrI-like small molecule binding domain-containing protein [Paenibacillus sp. 1_12]